MKRDVNVVITGASGLLGRAILDVFEKSPFKVRGWGFSRADGLRVKKVDVTHQPEVTRALEDFLPDIVIHAAAERHPDVIEKKPEAARDLNVGATEFLGLECARLGAKLIYISTDYVFDGNNPPYSESSLPHPLNAYGETKLLGEKATLFVSASHVVFRVPILFGEVQQLDESAVTILFKALRDTSRPCKMDDVQIRYPTHVHHVASALLQFSRQFVASRDQNDKDHDDDDGSLFAGIFHFSARESMTKFNMTVAMAEVFGLDAAHVEADRSAAQEPPPSHQAASQAKRPKDSTLSCERLEKLGIEWSCNFKEEIKKVLEPYVN